MIVWALEEPARVGECSAVTGRALVGRGGSQPDDPVHRAVFERLRPRGAQAPQAEPLGGGRISRVQLRLEADDGVLRVENVGRCPMLVRGVETKSATLKDGDLLVLKNALVLLVTERPLVLPAAPGVERSSLRVRRAGLDAPSSASRRRPGGFPGRSRVRGELAAPRADRKREERHRQRARGPGDSRSPRKAAPLVARNAATFPEGLVNAELFGSAKGYPHAGSPERVGLVGEADGGTLFLDEIGELPHARQAHLRRVLDGGGEYQRLGESRARRSAFRLVAATNREVSSLKHDFAARLAARVPIPTLRERREDVPLLARHLLRKLADATPDVRQRFFEPDGEPRIDPVLAEALVRHPYTHHLRELERLLWLAVANSKGSFVELGPEVAAELRSDDAAVPTEEVDETRIRAALAEHKNNVTRAARSLGLKNRYVLYRLMRRHGIEVEGADEEA
ncbi:MAG: sigma 54-interacting transcriptional regulator [Polyangiaceae bacterium]